MGPCFYLDERKSLATIPLGTVVEVSELAGAMVMRWTDSESEKREHFYPVEFWQKHMSKHVQPI
jgi:hypothetical protein